MDLDEYVRETLLGIVRAIVAAQADETVGGYIGRVGASSETVKDESQNSITKVAFDLATTVEDRSSAGGGVGVKVIPFIRADADAKIEGSQSTVSRIAFEVPIAVPRPEAQRAEDADRSEKRKEQKTRLNERLRSSGRAVL